MTLPENIEEIIEDSPFLSKLDLTNYHEKLALILKNTILSGQSVTAEWQIVLLLGDLVILESYNSYLMKKWHGGSSSSSFFPKLPDEVELAPMIYGSSIFQYKDKYDRNAIHFAALTGDFAFLSGVIGQIVDRALIFAKDKRGCAAIHYAAAASSAPCLTLLFEQWYGKLHFYQDQKDQDMNTVLCYAAENADRESAEGESTTLYFLRGLCPDGVLNIHKNTILHLIARCNNIKVLKWFEENCIDLNVKAQNNVDYSPFHVAASKGNLEMFRALELLADDEPIDFNKLPGPALLPLAVQSGVVVMAQYLIDEKKLSPEIHITKEIISDDPNRYTIQKGANLLYFAALSGNKEMVDFIYNKGSGISPSGEYRKDCYLAFLNALYSSGNTKYFRSYCGELMQSLQDPNFLKDWFQFNYAYLCGKPLGDISSRHDDLIRTKQPKLEKFFKKIGSFILYHAIYELDVLNDLSKRFIRKGETDQGLALEAATIPIGGFGKFIPVPLNKNYHKNHKQFFDNYTVFFVLHDFFVNKTQDKAYKTAFAAFSDLLFLLKDAKRVDYKSIVEQWKFPKEIQSHRFGERLQIIKQLPPEVLKEIVPQYLAHLKSPVYAYGPNAKKKIKKEETFIDKLKQQIGLEVNNYTAYCGQDH